MDLNAYLARLGLSGNTDDVTLASLHRAHLTMVPFENLDIHAGLAISLDTGAFHDKIVGRRRGGFCYELNGLFAELLRHMGFAVTLLSARVISQQGAANPEFDHLALLVEDDGPWLVDVGFGDAFFEPLRLRPRSVQSHDGADYLLDQEADGWTMRQRLPNTDWQDRYRFTLTPRELSDFAGMCRFHQTSPLSHFTTGRICSRRTPDGMMTLVDDRLVISEDGARREIPVVSEADFAARLRDHFGIKLAE